MRVRLDYGTEGLDVDLPGERTTIIEPMARPAVADARATLLQAIRSPLGRPPLRDLVSAGQKVAISVCDITRAQPRKETIEALFEEMPQVDPKDVTILIATGTHRTNTDQELERMLGREILGRYRVINHNSRERSTLSRVGATSTGVEVYLNREWL
ncbi:MAG TPA: lactate racemase domain-containing protein, partial [Gemmatimonadales bacterium]|nr:lactate racemase domain-containing protein [Gemmatimonadales bacterium]